MKNILQNILLRLGSAFFAMFLLVSLVPAPALAQLRTESASGRCPVPVESIGGFLCRIQQLVNAVIPLLIAIGVVFLVWGIIKYMVMDSEEAKDKGRDTIIYGIIGLTVIVGLWGLVNIVVNTFGFSAEDLAAPELAPIAPELSDDSVCELEGNVQGILRYFTCLINNSIIPFLFALAILMFVWGAVKFFFINGSEEAERAEGRQFMIWGIVALAVMVCVWGLVEILGGTLGIDGSVLPQVCPPGSDQCD